MRQDNRPRKKPYAGAAVFLIFGFAFAGMTHHAPKTTRRIFRPPLRHSRKRPRYGRPTRWLVLC